MRTAVFATILFLLAGNVLAEPKPWMKKENPEELRVVLSVPGCRGDFEGVVDGALARARIKRATNSNPGELLAVVEVLCLDIGAGRYAFAYGVHFGRILSGDGIHDNDIVVYSLSGAASVGAIPDSAVGRQQLEQTIRDYFEKLLADYLKANFDL